MHLTRLAHAKLNLALSVGPPEPPGSANPGMHPIASWMHCIELYDTVHLARLGEHDVPTFENRWAADAPRSSPIDWPPEKDLAVRALRLIEQTVGRPLPVSIRIEKRIPAGGGLGGGSSDAAAVLDGVNQLCSLGLPADVLARLSAGLGSDVAFFLGGSPAAPALVRGMGEQIERLPRRLAGQPVILVLPPFGCPTGAVYRAYDALGPRPLREDAVRMLIEHRHIPAAPLFNDLLAAAKTVQPALGGLCARILVAAKHSASLSGSGSTLFLLPASGESELAAKIRSEVADISVLVTRLI